MKTRLLERPEAFSLLKGQPKAHSIEAAHLSHAAGKLMGAFNDAVLTVHRRRSGGKQVVQVIHQQVAVGSGGTTVVELATAMEVLEVRVARLCLESTCTLAHS